MSGPLHLHGIRAVADDGADAGAPAHPRHPAALLPAARVPDAVRSLTTAGSTTVFVSGCFDLLHAGHAAHLVQASTLGDTLVVGLHDDASAARRAGPGRPVDSLVDRARVVGAFGCVDFVVVFADDTPLRLLAALRPVIYAKGGDYAGERLPEMDLVEQYGGQVRILDYFADESPGSLVERIAWNAHDEARTAARGTS
ncbi:adenylyltransferase/cytidyltransferase family protein [Microbacterium mangrovi]|uniref:adenylyltransferase/cytidyltransferase family protein n=1 Tax=Microbacterium mangrovi TaxID=1348253 RepID=UPI000691C6D5|nr:adenylyltransferase/cytidyltransferase family protein [Microbacterium mangrovi]